MNVLSLMNQLKASAALARLVAFAAIVAGLFAWFVHDQRNIGGHRAIAKVEKANATAVKRAESAAQRSRDPNARGVLDPYTRAAD